MFADTYPWPTRLLAWLLVALLMPLLASSLARHGMDRRSSTINLGLLVVLSGFSGVARFGLLGFQVDSGLAAVLLVVGIAVSLLYNWLILWKLDDL
jgi:hypothetical protein